MRLTLNVSGEEICVKAHALYRYAERVRPGIGVEHAGDALLEDFQTGRIRLEKKRPPWLPRARDLWGELANSGFLTVESEHGRYALPVARDENGRLHARTVLLPEKRRKR